MSVHGDGERRGKGVKERERERLAYQLQSHERLAAAVMRDFVLITDTDITSIYKPFENDFTITWGSSIAERLRCRN